MHIHAKTRQLPPLWRGVRMRRTSAGADPDEPARLITLPAAWDDAAAAGLAELAPGTGPVERWRTPPRPGSARSRPGPRPRPGVASGRTPAPLAAVPPRRALGGGLAGHRRSGTPLRAEPAGVLRSVRRLRRRRLRPRRSRRRPVRWRSRRRARGASRSAWRTWPGCWRRWAWITARTPRATSPGRWRRSCAAGRMPRRRRLAPAAGRCARAADGPRRPAVAPDWPAPPEHADCPGLAEAARRRAPPPLPPGRRAISATTAIAPRCRPRRCWGWRPAASRRRSRRWDHPAR